MKARIKFILKSGKEQSLKRLHPWIFSGAIKEIFGTPADGDIVEVYSNRDEFLATGHFQTGTIAVRVLSFARNKIDDIFWMEKIRQAWTAREKIGLVDFPGTNAFRLVHGEGDFLPGLIIDFYNGTAVIQAHSVGMYFERQRIARILKDILGDRLHCVYDKSESGLSGKSGSISPGEYIYGYPVTRKLKEYHNIFEVDWESGQKTGFYLDQRENRKLVGEYCEGRRVLNMFCYTGGFSVYALRAGASMVHSVDSSRTSIQLADINISHNFPFDNMNTQIRSHCQQQYADG